VNTKDRLNIFRDLLRKIQRLERQLETLDEGLTLPNTTNPSAVSVQGGERPDHLPLKLYQIDTIRRELESLYVLREQEHDELWKTVDLLTSVAEVSVLRSYYFSLQSREEVAQQLFEDEEDFQQRRKYYLSRVSQIHSRAMRNIRKISSQKQSSATSSKLTQAI